MKFFRAHNSRHHPGIPPRRPPAAARPRRTRGSVLIVALLVAALIAVVLGSYLNLNLASSRLARRTFNGYAALNLAEAGLEEGVWSFNRATTGDAAAWSDWIPDSAAVLRKFGPFELSQNTTGWARVYIDNAHPAANGRPKIIAQATVGAPGESPVAKILEVSLRRRSFFADGLVAKESVVFNGANVSVDSWNSDPDQSAATAPVPYSAAVRTDRGSVASAAFLNTAISVNQANVWGYVATGGEQPQVGSNGRIRGANTPANVAVDSRRISTDFNANFDVVGAPEDGTPVFTLGPTIGVAGTATKWRTSGIVLKANETLTVYGDVTLILTAGSGTTAISVTGNAAILVPDGSSLKIYAEGNVAIAGNGLGNYNLQPISFQLWGTNRSRAGQTIGIKGNGALRAAIYAPSGDVSVNGNGDVMGSIVARNITLNGNAAFHYDEALRDRESNAPYTVAKWRELSTEADRAPYSTLFNF